MDKRVFLTISVTIFICILGANIYAASMPQVSLELFSDKNVYEQGENVNLTLIIQNNYSDIILGQIKGKVIIGDIGYEIQCFDYNAPSNDTILLGLTPLPASFSNSNRKTMTTLYACSGTNMQSSKTMTDNTQASQNSGSETFELGPFTYSYTYNNTDYDVKSNTVNITVMSSQNNQNQDNQNSNEQSSQEQKNQESQSSTNQQNPNSGSQANNAQTQSSQTQQSSNLSAQNQQALSNNQQNAQSVNQLKDDIAKAKQNPLNTQLEPQEKRNFWISLIVLILIIIISVVLYFKYIIKEELIEDEPSEEQKPQIPKYIKLLDNIEYTSDDKEKAKLISQSIRCYIGETNNLNEDITHSKALKFTKNKLFIDILQKTEKIEFANKSINLDYNKIIKQLKGEMKNE